jgi:5-methylcytosine-specific restriction endonuclease McrA
MRICQEDSCKESCKPNPRRPGKFLSRCSECHAKHQARVGRNWYERHKEERIRKTRENKKANPEVDKRYRTSLKGKEAHRRTDAKPEKKIKHREYMRVRMRTYGPEWRAANPEKAKAKVRRAELRRKARHANAPGTVTEDQLQARIDFYGRRCYLCGCDWDALDPFDRVIDHVIPLSRGGTGWPSNLRPACRLCNARKWANPLADASKHLSNIRLAA